MNFWKAENESATQKIRRQGSTSGGRVWGVWALVIGFGFIFSSILLSGATRAETYGSREPGVNAARPIQDPLAGLACCQEEEKTQAQAEAPEGAGKVSGAPSASRKEQGAPMARAREDGIPLSALRRHGRYPSPRLDGVARQYIGVRW